LFLRSQIGTVENVEAVITSAELGKDFLQQLGIFERNFCQNLVSFHLLLVITEKLFLLPSELNEFCYVVCRIKVLNELPLLDLREILLLKLLQITDIWTDLSECEPNP
jgi:hypothetical protein